VWPVSIRVMAYTHFDAWSERGSDIAVGQQWRMAKRRQGKGPRSAFKVVPRATWSPAWAVHGEMAAAWA
jgi:hypothetical protein